MPVNTQNYTGLGLNTDSVKGQLKQGQLTFALNAVVYSWDGQKITYQNEPSDVAALTFPDNLKVIGVYNITQLNRVVYFLTNGTKHQVGYSDNGENEYHVLLEASCLNFSFNHPIHQIVIKTTNCSTEVYWTDAYNSMRYFSFDDLPWVETPNPDDDYNPIKQVGQVDCNKLLVQPNFKIPRVEVDEVVEGGTVKEGSYQFVVQYANSDGESYSSFYNCSNPVSVHDDRRATESFDLPTSYAIKLHVDNLDTSGVFEYYNLVVIENINATSTPKLVGTYPISNKRTDIAYTGETQESIQLSMVEIFEKYPHYDTAEGVTTTDNRLVWYNLTEKQRISYQDIVTRIPLLWKTVALTEDAYSEPLNTYDYKGYMRDEVYPFEMVFLLRGGKQTDKFPFIGREATSQELENGYWGNHNTASVITEYPDGSQLGKFAYWESTEKYPNSAPLWGELRNTPIRHFKFPDEAISPRIRNIDGKVYIYPIGIHVNKQDVLSAIENSTLSQTEKDEIVGFKIVRGDRSVGNNSIVAKGHFTNVGKYNYESQDYYFPNYPYNDVGDDPLYATHKVKPLSGFDTPNVLKPFNDPDTFRYLTFHSPDTHFAQPFGIDSGSVKIEAVDYGQAQIHFTAIDNNAEYKFATPDVIKLAVALAASVAFDFTRGGKPSFNSHDALQMFSSNKELLEKLMPFKNFGYNINSIASFDQTKSVQNQTFNIEEGKYMNSEFNSLDKKIVNNWNRESNVMLKIDQPIQKAHEMVDVPEDNSRIRADESLVTIDLTMEEFFNKIVNETDMTERANLIASVITGVQYAAADLADGDQNFTLALMPLIARLLQHYTETNDFSGLSNLQTANENCNVIGAFPSVTLAADDPDTPTNEVNQYIVITINDVVYNDNRTVENDYLNSFSSNTSIPINYYDGDFEPTQEQIDQATDDYYTQFFSDGGTPDNPTDDTTPPPPSEQTLAHWMLFNENFLLITQDVCGGDVMSATYAALSYAKDIYSVSSFTNESDANLSMIRVRDVNAYYGSIKRYLPSQWGQIHSYSVVDTGIYYELTDNEFPTIFGGDTFINKFSFKTKLSVFRKKTVGLPDQADVDLDEQGNLGYPMYYISTKPIAEDFKIDYDALSTAFGGIGLVNGWALTGSVTQTVGATVMTVGLAIASSGIGAVAGVIVAAVGGLVYLIGSLLKNVRTKIQKAAIKLYKNLFQQIIDQLGIKRINLDLPVNTGISHKGIFYQYVYGIPTYYVESQVNVDMRQATNDNEGNYYPRVGDNIPDTWLQENRIPIIRDNVYSYNRTFSKQNKENSYTSLREDYDYSKPCFKEYPNRAFWSDKYSLNETINNWLIYRPSNRFDFPKEFGRLTALNGILNRQVLARFENKAQLYNTLTTISTDTIKAYIGSNELFSSAPPLDILDTDQGSMGSQNKFLLRTEFGIIYIDAKRGQIVLLNGNNPKSLADEGMSMWFKEHLPFRAPIGNIDNHFTDVGIHGVYDEFYKRLLITKKDYTLVDGKKEDLSWTLSFSFITNSWTAWHSYQSNSYIPFSTYFQAVEGSEIRTHNKVYDSFCNYNGKQYPYILEYPISYKAEDEILQSISDYSTSIIYSDFNIYHEPDETLYFNKAHIYNNFQSTGILTLVPKPRRSLSSYMTYPKYYTDSKEILITKTDGVVHFNTFWDIVKDKNNPFFTSTSFDKELIPSNLDYTSKNYKKATIRSKDVKVRLILDKPHNFKLLSSFINTQTTPSKI